jgi:ribosome-associated protein
MAMLEVNDKIRIPDREFTWTFARSGGPGGQNVNKVASKAVLHWNVDQSPSVPFEVKARLFAQQSRRFFADGALILSSQRFRDQERNRQDCLDKLRLMLLEASVPPKPRIATRPTRGARQRRLQDKRQQALRKARRRFPRDND